MSQQPDFLRQREWLREVVEDAGHQIIFFPKYHCELNYIEMVWAYIKSQLKMSCTHNFQDMLNLLPHVADNIPIAFIRGVSTHCFRVMSCYRVGLEGALLDYAVRKYRSHRSISATMVLKITAEYRAKNGNPLEHSGTIEGALKKIRKS
jgi:hypothetical protein